MNPENTTYSLSIASGKGGVGKTNLTLNLGFALHALEKRVILMDCDMGLANLDILLGISPEHTIQDLLHSALQPEDILVSLAPGFDLLPAASGVAELIEFDLDTQAVLFSKLTSVFQTYDYLFLDLGAGISPSVLAFAEMPQERIIIITPEPTSLTDSYAFIKVLSSQTKFKHFQIIVNMVESQKEAQLIFNRLQMACEKFLQVEIHLLGYVRQDKNLQNAVRDQKPLFLSNPQSPACRDIFTIAEKLTANKDRQKDVINQAKILRNTSLKKETLSPTQN